MKELGAILLEARTERGLSLEELEQITRIRVDYLKAVEEGSPEKVPGEVYYRAFVRTYAREVGLDPDELLVQYEMRHMPQTVGEEQVSLRQRRAKAKRKRRLKLLISVVGLAVVAGLVYWLWTNGFIGNN